MLRWQSSPYKVQQAKLLSQQRTLTVSIKTMLACSAFQALGIRVERSFFPGVGASRWRLCVSRHVGSMPWKHLDAASFTFVFPLCFVVVEWFILYPHPPERKSATGGPVLGPLDNKLFRGEFFGAVETYRTTVCCPEVPKPYLSLHFPVRCAGGG